MLYTKVNTAKAEAWKSNSTLASANPMLVAAESLWCSPNAVLYRREHAFLHENINLVELITFFTLDSDGSKQISAPTAILSYSTAVLSNEHIWVLLPSRSVSGKWEMSPCLGGSPGAAILFSGILKC